MISSILFFTAFLALGAVAGFLAGLFGIGGGMIIVPALVYLFPLMNIPADAVMSLTLGTSFATIVITSFASTQRHYHLGNIQWTAVKFLAPSLMVTAYLTAGLVSHVDRSLVLKLFAVIVAYLALQMFLSIKQTTSNKKLTPLSAIVGGIVIGTAASSAGIGGGGFTVPFLSSRGVAIKQAIGSSAFCSMVLGLSGTISYIIHGQGVADLPAYSLGYVYLPAVLGITLTSFFTAKLGAHWVSKLPVATLKRYFAGLLIIIAIDMFLK